MKKIGLFGGTFNPIHFGHLRAAIEVKEKLQLEKVVFIPVNLPPHKDDMDLVNVWERINMLKLAIAKRKGLEVCEIEAKRGGKSYTIDTLREFKARFGRDLQLYFILGVDAFLEIETWKEYKEIFKETNLVVLERPGFDKKIEIFLEKEMAKDFYSKDGILVHSSGNFVIPLEITKFDISSSMIRALIRDGKEIGYLVPKEVENYILEKKLYKEEK